MRSDVVVVGAGAAGLAAAQRLAKSEFSVTILEARDRLGGRIWSHDPWGERCRIDLGAEFIHDSELAQRFAESGLVEIDQRLRARWDSCGRCLYEFSGERIGCRRWSRGYMRLVWNGQWHQRLAGARGSVANAIRKWPSLARKIAIAEVQGFYAADAGDLSAQALSCGANFAAQWWPRGGYRSLVEKLRQGLDGRIHRTDPVARIERAARGGALRVITCNKRRFEAARVIVAVSLGVLKSSDIRFVPRLSRAKRAAIRGIGMGDVVKVVVRCRPFWGKYRFISSDQDIPVWWPLPKQRADRGIIVGWAAGPAARKLRRLGTEEIKRRAVSSLRRLFPKSPVVSFEDVYVVDWSRDKFARGAYTYDRLARGGSLRRQLAEPEDNLLFFAGEATEPIYYGTVHGAIRSGQGAADLVLDSLRARQ